MNNRFTPRVGGVLSADIAVPQHDRVVRFYSHVLNTGESPLWREDLLNNFGVPIIGVGAISAEYPDLPLQWMPHIQTADVAQSAAHALELGGSEILHAKGDDGRSQWAVLLDPNGAAFGIIPVVSSDEIPPIEGAAADDAAAKIGCISWLDLTITDAAATRDFYQKVVGWSSQDVEMADKGDRYVDYNMLGDDGNPAAGICNARGVNLGLPPVWMLYLPVDDFAGSLRRVREGGGKIIKEINGSDEGIAYAVVQDPVGAYFALVR